MRIGLTGVGGTGKNRLANAFYKKHPEVKFIPSVVQHIGQILSQADHYEEIDAWQKPAYQQTILMAQAETERVANSLGMSYITAQSIIDFAPYYNNMLNAFDKGSISEKDIRAEYDSYIGIIKKYLRETPYNILFYVPLDLSTERIGDAWKKTDAIDSQKMDEQLREAMQSICLPLNIKVVALKGTDDERIAQMEEVLKDMGYELV